VLPTAGDGAAMLLLNRCHGMVLMDHYDLHGFPVW
jgi:hypothetical protein